MSAPSRHTGDLEVATKILKDAQRIVVKVGSSTLTRNGELRPRKFTDLSVQIAQLIEQGRQVVLVSSGAIAVGSRRLGWSKPARSIPAMQAAAAVGQIGLVELYQRRFGRLGLQVAQILLTRAGLEDRERFLNARHTIHELLRLGVVPIVNENDTVATEEIRFGDNDNLSAHDRERGGGRPAGDPHRRGRAARGAAASGPSEAAALRGDRGDHPRDRVRRHGLVATPSDAAA